MDDNQTVQSILENKPIKPKIEDFDLSTSKLEKLDKFKKDCKNKSDLCLFMLFLFVSFSEIFVILSLELNWFWIFVAVIISAIITWSVTDQVIKIITKQNLVNLIFDKTKTNSITEIDTNNLKYTLAKADYSKKNELHERVVRRMAWNYWQSLSALDFEDAVADMFDDKGWTVRKTSYKGDQGVDIFIEKDGQKGVVQCKTYKKVIGPNVVRDLYGTMVSQNATIAYLAGPGGFSRGAKDFSNGKPIKLLDIDGLTQMFYDFENYKPYWIDNAKSIEDLQKGINKMLGRRRRF